MEGYNRLAGFIGARSELAIFRSFRALNARNLLCLEAEIIHLEDELQNLILEDQTSDDAEKRIFGRSIYALIQSVKHSDGLQWKRTVELRSKLKEYNDFLIQGRLLASLPSPSPRNLSVLRACVQDHAELPFPLDLLESRTWDKDNEADLLSLGDLEKDKDAFSKMLGGHFLPWFHHLKSGKRKDRTSCAEAWAGDDHAPFSEYSDSVVSGATSAATTILASMIPVLAILALYFIQSPLIRLGLIAVFTLVFSIVVTTMTRACKADCFTASAAFAAVLVIFVGNNGTICGTNSG